MGSRTPLNPSAKKVLEFLLSQKATVEELAAHLERDQRTAYRAIEDIRELEGYSLLRTGNQGSYTYFVMQKEEIP